MSRKYKQYHVKIKGDKKTYSFMVEFEKITPENKEQFENKCTQQLKKIFPDINSCEILSCNLIKG